MRRLVAFIQALAETLGGPGLTLVAFLDSSFLSLPQICDILVVLMVIRHPGRWLYYSVMLTAGSVAGCYALYLVGRKGGEALLRRRFHARSVDRGLAAFRRHGLLAVIIPSLLPPPMPFKLFVLVAGVSKVRPTTFALAVAAGRGFRYVTEALLARLYGIQAIEFIEKNLPLVSLWLAIAIAVGAIGFLLWRRARPA